MQDTDLLVQLAGIAGVFVGFGALIAVRSGGANDADEVQSIRLVVSIAIWVVVAALTPVPLGRYGLAGHDVWFVGGILALVFLAGVLVVNMRMPGYWGDSTVITRAQRARMVATYWPPFILMVGALVLVVLGLFPEQDPALYLTALVLALFLTALTLLELVLWQGPPQAASDPAAMPATGGSGVSSAAGPG